MANIGGRIARWMLLAKALPQVVPGVRFEQSYLGQAVGNLGHVENLPQRLPIVLGAALIAASALGLGSSSSAPWDFIGSWTGPSASRWRSGSGRSGSG